MSVQDVVTVSLTVVAMTVAAVDNFGDVVDRVFPPVIEGRGWHDDPVTPGETALVTWQIAKRTGCPGENWRVWFGADGFAMTEAVVPTTLPMTDDLRTYQIPTLIPAQAPEGQLTLEVHGYYQCIGSPRVNWELGPVEFIVIEGES